MKLVFSLEYRTDWGQDLRAEVTLKRKRGADVRRVYPLHTDDGLNWTGEALVTEKDIDRFTYRYAVYEGDLVFRQEWDGVPRDFPAADRNFVLSDYWKDIPSLQHLYSSAYLNCITHTQAQKADRMLLTRALELANQCDFNYKSSNNKRLSVEPGSMQINANYVYKRQRLRQSQER